MGKKLRRYCDTLWEIVGFTRRETVNFIRKYFKNIDKEHLAEKLIEKLWYADKFENLFLYEFTKTPLNTTLVCVLCEDFDGVFPTSRTQLYTEIVPCFLRRYEKKRGRSSKNEDLMGIYKEELMPLGRVALQWR